MERFQSLRNFVFVSNDILFQVLYHTQSLGFSVKGARVLLFLSIIDLRRRTHSLLLSRTPGTYCSGYGVKVRMSLISIQTASLLVGLLRKTSFSPFNYNDNRDL